jgi:hypothetical protein
MTAPLHSAVAFMTSPSPLASRPAGIAPTPRTRPPLKGAPDRLLAAFNTWAFKREQPDGLDHLRRLAAQAVERQRPLSFVLYWGKGPRHRFAEPDQLCLDYLATMARRIADVHAPGAALCLVLTDTHADLNGHAAPDIDAYFGAITEAARARGFTTVPLSRLTRQIDPSTIAGERPDPATLARLDRCAAKWFRGEGSSEDGARRYFAMNMLEKRAVERAFPESVFVTFNGSDYRCLFPETLPVFYMYALRRGVAVKPWFQSEDGRPAAPAGA